MCDRKLQEKSLIVLNQSTGARLLITEIFSLIATIKYHWSLVAVSRKHSSDTSESECEPSSHPSRRSGVFTRGIASSSRVFGLTEVSLQRGRDGDSREVRF